MSASQTEAIATVASSVGGTVFVTQPAKAVESSFASFFPDANVLIDNNDPYSQIENVLASTKIVDTEENQEFLTVFSNGSTIFKNLPFLSSQYFKTSRVVTHAELVNFDYSIVSGLRDLSYPVLISQSAKEASNFSKAAYNLAARFNTSVFHFYAPSNYKSTETVKSKVSNVLLKDVNELDAEAIFAEFDIIPFQIVNTASRAKDSILFLGQVSDELIEAANKENALLISVKVYQPFQLKKLLSIIPSSVQTITLVQQSTSSSSFSPLLLDFFQDYSKYQTLKNFTKIVAATFGYIKADKFQSTIANLLSNVRSESPIQNLSFGKVNTELATKSSKQRVDDHAKAVASAYHLEQAYLKVLNQVNSSNLNILNEYSADSIGLESNPEFGFGSFLYDQEQQQHLIDVVYQAVQDNTFHTIDNANLIEYLSKWLVQVKDVGSVDNKLVEDIISLLKTDEQTTVARTLLSLSEYFKVNSNWLIGSDAWSYDLGSSGVHSLITSGKNINMLLIDSEPYQEKADGKAVNGNRKKDVGLYAMNYGNVYVASVAIYSSYTQVLQALIEAEKFNGPSIVLAYLPYNKETDNTLTILQETKKAVDTGYWPLYRYDPSIENEADSFKLDSSNLRKQLKAFLDRENKLTLLATKNPELSRNLTATANSEVKKQQQKIADESYAKLLQGLSGPPLTVAFASDGGNAEGIAKKVNRQALGRGLKSIVLSMDDLSIEDLPTETNIVFVVSTSGQGEFPTNGKQFWDGLKNATDLELSTIKYSVFGLGDSQYWPRKEDKHYYNKPAKDLDAKLKLYGGVELAELGLGDDQDADGFSTGFNEWIPKIWKALGVDNVEGVEEPKPITNEDMKIGSNFLRGTIAEALLDQSTGSISAVDQQLTKFHGIYMQDDRDIRDERKSQGFEPAYSFMVRVRLPGGIATPNQYLKMNELSDVRGNGTLKITTRATFQLHGVVKHNLKPAIRGMNASLMDTLAACGDVNRNVMVSALPHNAKVHSQISKIGSLISEHLLPNTTAYHEIWLSGDDESDKPGDKENWETRKEGPTKTKTLVAGNALADVEPLYGNTYLPRKFKIVITVPPFNDVDVYAHDIGLIAIVVDNEVVGFNLMAGGGMGSTHNNKKTYPRTGSMFGYVPKDKVHLACEKIMLVQRDFGDRTNRKHARLKYTIDDLTVEVFKGKVEDLLGFKFEPARDFKIESNIDYFGWCKDETGLNHFTAFIENGRIEDTAELPQKSGLKAIAEFLAGGRSGEFRLTGNQHIVISKIEDADLAHVKSLLAQYKLDNTDFSALRLSSSSCVAFPTCGLAMAESERYMPQLITKLESSLEEYGLRHDSVVMRMTGCPNGCARPWLAEVALVGKAYGAYNLLLGGGHHGERLNKIYRYSIKEDEILEILLPLFRRWSLEREDGEFFGDFCIRVGIIKPTTEGKYFHDDIPEDA
ncbi:putative sulfite reductase [nadph] beta subunit [Scheffersomyces xylosifermentans]|uniref:putative sulfite reductase [nadph] beta subunit n=1 Tax=Scheffersomyces xylosifermentans TaxID=1304137 RepID=UPI00315DF627